MAADNSFESLSTPARVFILIFILAFVGGIYFFVFHSPLMDDIASANTRHTQLEDDQREAERRQEEYLRVTEELSSREAVDRENKRILPEDAEMAAFLQDLNRVAELSGLEMKLVEPRPEEAEQLYVRLPVSLTLSGRFHQLAKFFYNVSQLRRAINMENIVLSEPESNDADEVILSVDVLATTFRRNATPAAGGAQ